MSHFGQNMPVYHLKQSEVASPLPAASPSSVDEKGLGFRVLGFRVWGLGFRV